MIGVIDTGGGERGIYGAGVLDYCLKNGISFDVCLGVSAGSANVVSYIAGQQGRNFRFYIDYNFRGKAMGLHQLFRRKNFINLDYIYGTISNQGGEDPLDFPAMLRSGKKLFVVATDAQTGQPTYFTMNDMALNQYDIMKASSCIPGVNKPYPFKGHLYYDGGISDPLPIRKALETGCEKVVVILSRPLEPQRESRGDRLISRDLRDKYPKIAEKMEQRAILYNQEVEYCKKLSAEGRVLIIAPDTIGNLKTLTRDREALKHLYHKGQDDATAIIGFLGIKINLSSLSNLTLSFPV